MKTQFQTNKEKEAEKFLKREQDWRNGNIVYQVLVDRFMPSSNLEAKKDLYKYPRRLMNWEDLPEPGPFMKEVRYTEHELQFWGGDLQSVIKKLDYIKELGVETLYLNPIHLSLSNHKYDASDYKKISPEFGTMEDLKELADKLHQNNQKLVLDGVFNHVGVTSDLFLEAKDPNSKKHNWFDFNDKYPEGVRLWADARSLPELNLENQEVRDYIYNDEDSVIKTYLKNGVDGWRLDVAFDIGYEFLKELADAAHGEKPSSLVIGEIWNYPEKWLKSIDALMNFTFREIILRTLKGSVKPNQANKMFEKIIQDTGVEGILKSWNVLDNHDTQRLINALPNKLDQRLAQVLQFTLPGSPNLYYGTELGMIGGDDPKNRAPMKWDLVNEENEYLIWTKKLIDLHNSERALKIGDYVPVVTENFIGFERKTDKIEEAIIVLVNPTDELVKEDVLITDSSFMNYSGFITLLGEEQPLQILAGLMHIELKPKSYIVYKPDTSVKKSYTPYKRV